MHKFAFAAVLLALLAFCSTAQGLFEIKNPLSGVWKMSSIAVGTIESTRDDNHILTIKLTSVPKESATRVPTQGDASALPATTPGSSAPAKGFVAGDTLAIQIVKPEELCARIAKEQPVVIVRSGIKDIIVNIADDWYLAQTGNTPKILRIIGLPKDFRGTFPGHTSDLVKALDELKAGKYTLLDVAPPRLLSTQVRLGTVAGVKNVAVIAAGTDEKGRTLVYIRTAEGVNVFVLKDGVLEKGVDELAQMEFIRKHVVLPEAMENTALLKKSISMAKGGFGADGGQAVLTLQVDKLVRVTDWDKATAKADEDLSLLGSTLKEHITEWKEGITDGVISTCDVNGDGRDDAVIVSSKGSLVLLNRGFGVFLVVKAEGDAFQGALAATADPASGGLLVLRKAGDGTIQLWRTSTPKP